MKLTKTMCDRLSAQSKPYKKFDGGGLYIEVTPKGKKLWRLKYYFQGKEKRLSFGSYPTVTLKNARQKREDAKLLLDQEIDPSKERKNKAQNAILESNNSFKEIAMEWYDKQLERWGDRRASFVLQNLEKNIFPYIGNTPINQIKPLDLLEVLRIIEARGALEIVKRMNNTCSKVFKYGIITGRCEHNPAINLSGAFKTRPVKHFSSIEPSEIPQFLEALHRNEARLYTQTRNAVLFSMITFVRPNEVRHARWQDIDFENMEWKIPAEFMKMKKDHIVPLASQTIELLKKQRKETERLKSIWVFPGQYKIKIPMSDGTVNKAIRLLGFGDKMTAHGFRALARTAIREELDYAPDIIEVQLAHKPSGPLGAAYDRSKFLKQRKIMMQDWANYIL